METDAPSKDTWRPDTLTVIAIAVVAYGLANIAHEGLGHGGACWLGGGRPLVLSSDHFECDSSLMSSGAQRFRSAAGTIVNLLLALPSFLLLRRFRGGPHGRLFLWLFFAVNLLQACGYFLFSGVGNIGDWAKVIDGFTPAPLFRVGLAVLGGLSYAGAAFLVAKTLAPIVGGDQTTRRLRAKRISLLCYFSGGVLYCTASLLNPLGLLLLLISGAAASFGGTSAFLWCTEWLRGTKIPLTDEPRGALPRSPAWLALGALTAAVFIGVLGRGVRF